VKGKHKNQKRKFTNESYLGHLENTANILWETDELAETDDFVAALLHDVVEDTETSFKEVGQEFGGVVMNLVEELTSDKEKQNVIGKKIYLTEKINRLSERAFTIKLCDRLDNVIGLDYETIPLDFKNRYIKETRYIIKHLDRETNEVQQTLLKRLKAMLLYLETQGGNVCLFM
jgi:guanosine-3',5'-bis(diphosphate) 3'-pyrophosphohydrolase